MLVLSSCGSLCFLWKTEPVCSVYTAGWKTRPPDCEYKHRAGFFRPVHSHSYHRRAIKVFEGISILHLRADTFFLLSAVCSALKLCFGLVRVLGSSLHGLFLWHGNLETIQKLRSFILQLIRSLSFVWWEVEARGHITFHELLCQRSTQTNRWEPQDSPNWRLHSLIRHSCLQSGLSALFPSWLDGNLRGC